MTWRDSSGWSMWGGRPLPALSVVLVLVAVAASGTEGEPVEEVKGGLRLSVNDGGTIRAVSDAVVIAGATNAPPGSEVTVVLEGVSQQTLVEPNGAWEIVWSQDVPVGRYRVKVTVSSPDGRNGRSSQRLTVSAQGRLPRKLPDEGPVYVPGATSQTDDFQASTDRWRITPPPYELNSESSRWDPYNQNVLKGDFPIRGNDLFFVLTAVSDTLVEPLGLPTAAGISTAETELGFFGGEDQFVGLQTLLISGDLFKGDTAFRPIDWRIKGTVAVNLNYVELQENASVNPDVREGQDRTDEFLAIQELFFEYKLADLSPSYDFVSFRLGVQPFNSDFRGFIFDDINLGFRLFGNYGSNRNQFNLAYFDRLEKDTNSGLNTFELREQQVAVLNFYRQDFLVPGYTTSFSVHYLKDEASFFFDENNFLARPDPVGDFTPHEIEATYLGWTSFGHVGRLNIDSALYYVTGTDSLNPIAGSQLVLRDGEFVFEDEVDIEAYLAALELSVDRDWYRPRIAYFYTSGDDNLNDRDAEGFDAIFDNPNFAGGGFSFWNRSAIRLAGSGVALVSRGSLIPALKTSKEEGQPNFVNPGLHLASLAVDLELTPKVKSVLTANYLRFDKTEVIEGLLFDSRIDKEIGWDVSVGARYRPFLNQNFVILAGAALFLPGKGFEKIYEDDDELYQGFVNVTLTF